MKKIKNKLTKLKNYLNKEIKFTNADDIAISITIFLSLTLNYLTFIGITKIINLLKE